MTNKAEPKAFEVMAAALGGNGTGPLRYVAGVDLPPEEEATPEAVFEIAGDPRFAFSIARADTPEIARDIAAALTYCESIGFFQKGRKSD